jgi:hypothetical protein
MKILSDGTVELDPTDFIRKKRFWKDMLSKETQQQVERADRVVFNGQTLKLRGRGIGITPPPSS